MTMIAYPFLIFSAAGLVLSVISHVCAPRGIAGPLGDLTWLLHIGNCFTAEYGHALGHRPAAIFYEVIR